MSRVALQAHTIRAELAADWEGALRRVADMGYRALEMTTPLLRVEEWAAAGPIKRALVRLGGRLASTRGGSLPLHAARRLSGVALHSQRSPRSGESAGLTGLGYAFRVPGLHAPLPLDGQQEFVLRNARRLGAEYLVASLPAANFITPEAVQRTCTQLNAAAQVAAAHGLRLAYHNHWWEFEAVHGRSPFERMLAHLDPAVCFEVDVYWVQTAGDDPAAVVRRLGARAPLLHLKDGPATRDAPMTALGKGAVDLPAVLAASTPNCWWIVELDRCATDMFAAVEESYTFLQDYRQS